VETPARMAENRAALWLIDLSPGKEICPEILGINVHSGLKEIPFQQKYKKFGCKQILSSGQKRLP
jgi:hypothetical protein